MDPEAMGPTTERQRDSNAPGATQEPGQRNETLSSKTRGELIRMREYFDIESVERVCMAWNELYCRRPLTVHEIDSLRQELLDIQQQMEETRRLRNLLSTPPLHKWENRAMRVEILDHVSNLLLLTTENVNLNEEIDNLKTKVSDLEIENNKLREEKRDISKAMEDTTWQLIGDDVAGAMNK
ncbi:MAG: hypothetical protein Q9227_006017 [Pyrenula ochraceoflavens]